MSIRPLGLDGLGCCNPSLWRLTDGENILIHHLRGSSSFNCLAGSPWELLRSAQLNRILENMYNIYIYIYIYTNPHYRLHHTVWWYHSTWCITRCTCTIVFNKSQDLAIVVINDWQQLAFAWTPTNKISSYNQLKTDTPDDMNQYDTDDTVNFSIQSYSICG